MVELRLEPLAWVAMGILGWGVTLLSVSAQRPRLLHSSKAWDVIGMTRVCPSVCACFPVVTGPWPSGTLWSKALPSSEDSRLCDLLIPQPGPGGPGLAYFSPSDKLFTQSQPRLGLWACPLPHSAQVCEFVQGLCQQCGWDLDPCVSPLGRVSGEGTAHDGAPDGLPFGFGVGVLCVC